MNNSRLLSLDVMRGITIAGMILVNNAGNSLYMHHSNMRIGTDSPRPTWFSLSLCL